MQFKRMAIVTTLLMLSANVFAADDVVQWATKASSQSLRPGEKFTVELNGAIESGWHMYSITQAPGGPTTTVISMPANQPFKLAGAVRGPAPNRAYDPNFEMETETYEGEVRFEVPVEVEAHAAVGERKLTVDVLFQVCNDTSCLPPTTAHVSESIKIVAGATPVKERTRPRAGSIAIKEGGNTPPLTNPAMHGSSSRAAVNGENEAKKLEPLNSLASASSANPVEQNRTPTPATAQHPLGSFLWLAMGMGALSLLTPCVFPMIPITVSYFTGHAAASRGRALRNALIYSLGIILTFSALGMTLALLVGAGGINLFAANPWVNLLITAIFIGFAMNLFGVFEIQIPSGVLTSLDKVTRQKGGSEVIGCLLMGLTFTLTSFTCTAPFVGTLLVMAARGRWQWPLMGMLAFSTVFALPFFLLAWMPQFLARLPKSGGWLNAVKVVMGFLEVAAAMKFLSNADLVWGWRVFTREVVLAIWVALGVLTALYLLGVFQLAQDSKPERIGGLRLTWTMICLATTFYLLTGLFGRELGELESFLPPETASHSLAMGATVSASNQLNWILNDYEGALTEAKQQHKRVFVDFTGYTCTNCRWMEANMFPRPEARRELERYVRVRLYTDGEGKVYQAQQKMQQRMFGTVALPFYAILTSEGKPLATFPGLTRNAAEFVDFVGKGVR